jgi:hypothetical protein
MIFSSYVHTPFLIPQGGRIASRFGGIGKGVVMRINVLNVVINFEVPIIFVGGGLYV